MDILKSRYLKLNKYLLTVFGLWPYHSKITKHCNYSIFALWTLFVTIPLTQGFLDRTNLDIVASLGTVVGMAWIMGSFSMATVLYLKPHWLAKIYDQIEIDWKMITDPDELAIMKSFSRQGRSLTLIYMGSVLSAATFFLNLNFLPSIINNTEDNFRVFSTYSDRWVFLNNTRELQLIVVVSLEIYYGTILYITVMGVYVCGIKHACGMYAIVSYKLERLVHSDDNILELEKKQSDAKIIPELLNIIDKHRAAIKSAHIIGRIFNRTFYCVQLGELPCLAILIAGLHLSFKLRNIILSFTVASMLGIFMMHVFFMNYGGEQLIQYSTKVFTATYFLHWHLISPNARKVLLMIILRSSKAERLSAGAMTLSLQNFTTIIQISWSLSTVLLSTLL